MNSKEYFSVIETIKSEIKTAQHRASVMVNCELVLLYYNIGKVINKHKRWGNKFVENLAVDIKLEFPNAKGYSV